MIYTCAVAMNKCMDIKSEHLLGFSYLPLLGKQYKTIAHLKRSNIVEVCSKGWPKSPKKVCPKDQFNIVIMGLCLIC